MSRISHTEIEGIRIVNAETSKDLRGMFIKYHPERLLNDRLGDTAISINPRTGTIRGLHFQVEPFAEEKIVSCVQGSIFEVVVDLRPSSGSFGSFATFELSQKEIKGVYLPKGIAHGFQTLEPNTILHYCLTSQYSKKHSYAINPFSELNINWPISDMLVSDRDAKGISMKLAAQKFAESMQI